MVIAGKRDDHFRGPMNRGMRIDGFRAAQGNWTMIHVGVITKRQVTPREPNYHQEVRHENRHDTRSWLARTRAVVLRGRRHACQIRRWNRGRTSLECLMDGHS